MVIKSKTFELNQSQKDTIYSLTTKYYDVLKQNKDLRLIKKADLVNFFSTEELKIINELYEVDATTLGFMGEYVGADDTQESMVQLPSQTYIVEGKNMETGIQYLPQKVFSSLKQMLKAMQADGADTVLVNSAYRSPAYQSLLFLSYLRRNQWDIKKTASSVALPGYSQHGSALSPAVDFITLDGIPNSINKVGFDTTEQYKWLSKHANEYNFYLSYPKDNKLGVIFEPWHWRFVAK